MVELEPGQAVLGGEPAVGLDALEVIVRDEPDLHA
jgi:hypothetical protein